MRYKCLNKHQRPPDNQIVRYTEAGDTAEISWSSRRSHICNIVKRDKDSCLNRSTGEVITFQHTNTRADNIVSVKKSLRRGRDLLNANCTDLSRCLWVNLTYGDEMTDPKQLYTDVKAFIREMRKNYGALEYVLAAEPQGRGAWHCHIVIIFPRKTPFIPYKDLTAIWGHGSTYIQKIDSINNIGLYLTAYLADMSLSEAVKLAGGRMNSIQSSDIRQVEAEQDGQKIKKSIVKAARLHLYPPQFHIFRWSRGIKKPTVEQITAYEAEGRVANATLTFESTFQLSDDETGFESTINRRQYNRKP